MYNLVKLTRWNISTLYDVESSLRYDHLVIVTHSGLFHADDIMSAALVRCLAARFRPAMTLSILRLSDAQIKRERYNLTKHLMEEYVPVDSVIAYIVVDIGGGDFDHHNVPEEFRENGVPYASFGKLWRAIGCSLVGKIYADGFDATVVCQVDKMDNGRGVNPLGVLLVNFNPDWDSSQTLKEQNAAFLDAVISAQYLIDRYFSRINASRRAHRKFSEIYFDIVMRGEDPSIIVLDRFVPLGRTVADECSDVRIVVTKSSRSMRCWSLTVVSGSDGARCVIPKTWYTDPPIGCIKVTRTTVQFTSKSAAVIAARRLLADNNVQERKNEEKVTCLT